MYLCDETNLQFNFSVLYFLHPLRKVLRNLDNWLFCLIRKLDVESQLEVDRQLQICYKYLMNALAQRIYGK